MFCWTLFVNSNFNAAVGPLVEVNQTLTLLSGCVCGSAGWLVGLVLLALVCAFVCVCLRVCVLSWVEIYVTYLLTYVVLIQTASTYMSRLF